MVGPSKIISGGSVVHTKNGFYNTKNDQAQLFDRSTLEDKDKTITGDSLYYVKNGESYGYGNVVYVDKKIRILFIVIICAIMKNGIWLCHS